MAIILPFVARLARSTDWTASERAMLHDLADQLPFGDAGVEVVFGVTDEGDPWCVVKDANEDIIVHVARFGGQFVVHNAAADIVQESPDLTAALEQVFGPIARHEPVRGQVVVPFALASRQAQTFLAAIVATAFYYDTENTAHAAVLVTAPTGDGGDRVQSSTLREEHARAPDTDDASPVEAPASHGAAPTHNEADAPAAAPAEAAPRIEPAEARPLTHIPAPAPAAAPARAAAPDTDFDTVRRAGDKGEHLKGGEGRDLLIGGAGDDHLEGGAGADVLFGGEGNDLLDGGTAASDEVDVLHGGGGADTLILGARVVATGGDGGDTFVFARPKQGGGPDGPTSLGVVRDFTVHHGDTFQFRGAGVVSVVSNVEAADVFAELRGAKGLVDTPASSGVRVGLDFDGDGAEDAFVMLEGFATTQVHEIDAWVVNDHGMRPPRPPIEPPDDAGMTVGLIAPPTEPPPDLGG